MKHEVQITPEKRQKYVLVTVSGEKCVLQGSPEVEWHKDILVLLEEKYPEHAVLGGGWIHQFLEERSIYFWGQSDRLGKAPTDIVLEVLNERFPEYTIFPDQQPSN